MKIQLLNQANTGQVQQALSIRNTYLIIKIEFITFDKLVEKYSIKSIDKLQIDVEGAEYEILKTIDFKKTKIDQILFESKHFDGTFKESVRLDEIKNLLTSKNYKLRKQDKENILAVK